MTKLLILLSLSIATILNFSLEVRGQGMIAVSSMPEFEGGEKELVKYIKTRAIYTKRAFLDKVQGTVFLTFQVKTDGRVDQVEIRRGVHPDLDSVAVRIVQDSEPWKPAVGSSGPVEVRYAMRVSFEFDPEYSFNEEIQFSDLPERFQKRLSKRLQKNSELSPGQVECIQDFVAKYHSKSKVNDLHIDGILLASSCH